MHDLRVIPSSETVCKEVLAAGDRIKPPADEALFREQMGIRYAQQRQVSDNLWLIDDTVQDTGAFKSRGSAYAAWHAFQKGIRPTRLVAASSGNHANGVLAAANHLSKLTGREVEAHIYAVSYISQAKKDPLTRGGAQLHLFDDFEQACQTASEQTGLFIHPFEDPSVIAGQGLLGKEVRGLIGKLPADKPKNVWVPVGGGGLVSGIAVELKDEPNVNVIGVQMERCDAMRQARERLLGGLALENLLPAGLDKSCDGTAINTVGPRGLAICADSNYVHSILAVSKAAMGNKMVQLRNWLGFYPEPAGALAATAADRAEQEAINIAVVSGRNVAVPTIQDFCQTAFRNLSQKYLTRDRYGINELAERVPTRTGNFVCGGWQGPNFKRKH